MGGCSVVGCRNRFTRGKLHFYRFPKDVRRDVWIQFSRKGNSFVPKGSSTICEVHFSKECFMEKKDRVHLSKDAVPTIFFKQTNLGLEMVQVQYDAENRQYFGQESIELLRGNISVEDEEAIAIKRQQKLDDLKSLCRFCFCNDPKNESKCVSILKLDAYQIELNELLISLGLGTEPNEVFGDLVCEQCFQQIVEIDLFKKKCRESQEEIFLEIQELDNKIQEIRNAKSSGRAWHKSDIGLAVDDSQVEAAAMEVLEEHLVDEDEFDDVNYSYEPQLADQMENNGEYIEEIHGEYKIIFEHIPDANMGQEKLFKEIAVSDILPEEECQSMDIQVMQLNDFKEEDEKLEPQGVDEYQVASTDDIIKNPERNRFCFRIYECFFCKMVSS